MTSVLFDVPGPRARRRNLIGTVVGGLALVAALAWVVATLAGQGIFDASRWDVFAEPVVWEALIVRGLGATLRLAGISVVLACILGAVVTALRLSGSAFLRVPAVLFVELFRGLPVLLMMFIPTILFTQLSLFAGAVIGLTLYNAAIISEVLRSGIATLPRGQREAGLAIGLNPLASLRMIEMPQAVRIMLPALISQVVVLLKDTSLAFIIAYPELLRQIQLLTNFYGNNYVFSFFFVGAAIYILVNSFVSWLATRASKRGTMKAAGGKSTKTAADA